METIIVFFRDTLSGTLYTVVSSVCFILICICIWQLFSRSRKTKVAEEKFAASHVVIINAKGEEETIEVSSSVPITKGMSLLPEIMSSATTSPHNIPVTSAVPQIAYPDAPVPKVPNNKPVVMINPLEVATISSTLNVVGATSAQKSTMNTSSHDFVTSSTYNAASVREKTAGTVVNSQVVSALVEGNRVEFLATGNVPGMSQNNNSSNGQVNNQNFTN